MSDVRNQTEQFEHPRQGTASSFETNLARLAISPFKYLMLVVCKQPSLPWTRPESRAINTHQSSTEQPLALSTTYFNLLSDSFSSPWAYLIIDVRKSHPQQKWETSTIRRPNHTTTIPKLNLPLAVKAEPQYDPEIPLPQQQTRLSDAPYSETQDCKDNKHHYTHAIINLKTSKHPALITLGPAATRIAIAKELCFVHRTSC